MNGYISADSYTLSGIALILSDQHYDTDGYEMNGWMLQLSHTDILSCVVRHEDADSMSVERRMIDKS